MSLLITWIAIPGYSGYEVADCGAVRSVERIVICTTGTKRKVKYKLLKAKYNSDGYLFVTLSCNGIRKTCYLHRLVAGAFIQNPNNLNEVNHINGVKTDNCAFNLAWCTHQENVQHAYDTGLSTNMGGTHHMAIGIVDNTIGQEFGTIREWCKARGIPYPTGRNLVARQQKSKIIDMNQIVVIKKTKNK